MKLIIDIDENLYIRLFDNGVDNYDDAVDMAKAIRKGTLLPKGHGRLIDADKTISKICGNSCGCHFEECGHDEPCFSVTRIKSAPTIIEADKESEGRNERM